MNEDITSKYIDLLERYTRLLESRDQIPEPEPETEPVNPPEPVKARVEPVVGNKIGVKSVVGTNGIHQTLTIDGETLTMREWSDRSGIPIENIRDRKDKGWSDKVAVWAPLRKQPRRIMLCLEGVIKTAKEWSVEKGIGLGTIYYRLRRGFTDEQALSPVLLGIRQKNRKTHNEYDDPEHNESGA